MKNLLDKLKTMETESTGVKNDVINFLLAQAQDSEDTQGITDTVKYFEKHEKEIMEMLEMIGVEYPETYEGRETLTELLPQLDSADERIDEAEEKIREYAEEEVSEYYGDDWDEMDDEEKETAIQGYADNVAMYEVEPLKLTDHDKNYLAWAIFGYNASVLFDELHEMGLV